MYDAQNRSKLNMTRVALVAFTFAITLPLCQAQGQPVLTTQISNEMAASLPQVTTAVLQATGYQSGSIHVLGGAYQLVVTIFNSKLASQQAREAEAVKIALAISKAIASKPQFRLIQAFHIDYVTQEVNNTDPHLVDAIDFRKDPAGNFVFHKS